MSRPNSARGNTTLVRLICVYSVLFKFFELHLLGFSNKTIRLTGNFVIDWFYILYFGLFTFVYCSRCC